jgi:ABC-type histidine transport system ATPase subunit
MPAIELTDIHKRYYRSHALRGINLSVDRGKDRRPAGP